MYYCAGFKLGGGRQFLSSWRQFDRRVRPLYSNHTIQHLCVAHLDFLGVYHIYGKGFRHYASKRAFEPTGISNTAGVSRHGTGFSGGRRQRQSHRFGVAAFRADSFLHLRYALYRRHTQRRKRQRCLCKLRSVKGSGYGFLYRLRLYGIFIPSQKNNRI